MFIDTHCHSKGGSYCSRISIEDLIDFKKSLGYDGMILTNHVQPWYYKDRPFSSVREDILNEFRLGTAHAKKVGFRILLGVEVTIYQPHPADVLIYGDVPKLLSERPETCSLNQRELFDYCVAENMLMIQAHPTRGGENFLEPKFLHGVEINCQPNDLICAEQDELFAAKHKLKLTCGTDTHSVDTTTRGGVIVPDDILTSQDYADYVRSASQIRIKIDDEEFSFPHTV